MNNIVTAVVINLIRVYRLILSPYLGQHCRFTPTCSEYAIEAFQRHGLIKGMGLSIHRLSRCHPWHEGGLDPVPESNRCHCSGSVKDI